ncbi:MAG: hypothetical protein GXO61_02505 [Epsilonproteobacteria bacterium]|nr:hypothetical protein [Campylobacterota bacterium]
MRRLKLLLLPLFLFAEETTILQIEGKTALIEPQNLPIGISGIVLHKISKELQTIVARAILIQPDKVRFTTYDALAQPSLPTPNIKPTKGDEVILGYLSNRALAITPNLYTYQNLVSNFQDYEFLHPDLFATELSKEKNPAPTRKDFKNFCNKFALSTVFITLKDTTLQLDCYSFSILKDYPIPAQGQEVQLPFYSRVNKIEKPFFHFFNKKEVKDYYSYYKNLVEER